MSKTRLALIGCGGMTARHSRQFDSLTDRLDVTAAVDIVPDKARSAADLFESAEPAGDYHDILDKCDAVLIALPHDLHHQVGIDCLKAGKHVLMEKPLAITEQQCLDLIDTARQVQRTLMIAYCMRFHPHVVRIKEMIEQETFGQVFQVSIWTEQHTQQQDGRWMHKEATLGGGQLFSHGCHYIDLLLWYLGRPVQGVHIGTNYGTPWMEKEGTSNVVLHFESGALGYHFGTWGAKGTRLKYAIHAHCTNGMIEADLFSGRLWFHQGDKAELLDDISGDIVGDPKQIDIQMHHFLDCIQTGHSPLTNGPDSVQGLRVIWRLYEAESHHTLADLRGLGLDQVDDKGRLK